jgi:hypothetical protein
MHSSFYFSENTEKMLVLALQFSRGCVVDRFRLAPPSS